MKKFLGTFIQYLGAFLAICGIICLMLETKNLVVTLLVGFSFLIVGAVICYLGTEVEGAR